MMEEGKLTSVQLTTAYIERIEALNKRGPGLNAVTQLNKDALKEAAQLDKERAEGHLRGPAHGLPVLLKDLIDVKGMYTSNGNYSLRDSFPEDDSGVAKKLRASGVVILGKLGLSEYANSFGNQPSGFSNLTGQVLNALDADQNPSGSSSGSGAAGAAALSMLVGRHRDLGLDHQPVAGAEPRRHPADGRPRPGYGIGPISASQDTAGPMDRTVANAAMNLQSMAGRDPKNEAGYDGGLRPELARTSITRGARPAAGLHVGARPELRPGQAHRLQRHASTPGTPSKHRVRRARGRRRDHGRAARRSPSRPCPACPAATSSTRRSTSTATTRTSARSRRSRPWSRRSPTTRPTRTRR